MKFLDSKIFDIILGTIAGLIVAALLILPWILTEADLPW